MTDHAAIRHSQLCTASRPGPNRGASRDATRLRGAEKAQRTGDVVAKGGARDAFQVVANGGLFAVMALAAAALAPGSPLARTFAAAALGALAASAADTWATEIGSL